MGVLLYGVAPAGMIRAGVGLAPWDAFHVGPAKVVPGLTVGMASIGVSVVCLTAARWTLKMPVGIGSALNMVLIGLYLDFFGARIPAPVNLWAAWAMFLFGALGVGIATGAISASDFGAGPRDSLVLGLARRVGWSVKGWRTTRELVVLGVGWLLGAKIGWGTLAFALIIGPAMSAGMRIFGLRR